MTPAATDTVTLPRAVLQEIVRLLAREFVDRRNGAPVFNDMVEHCTLCDMTESHQPDCLIQQALKVLDADPAAVPQAEPAK